MAFVELVRAAAAETGDPALRACTKFYDQPDEVRKAADALAAMKPKSGRSVLAVVPRNPSAEDPGGPVVQRKAVMDYWRKHYAGAFAERVEGGGEGMCLISGKVGPIAPTHDKIKGVANLGGQAAGVSLMSFDKPAFRSYGWEKNANSPVSPDRATAYVLALNDLLRRGEHRRGSSRDKVVRTRFDCGGVAFLFWTREPSDDDIYALFNEAQPEQVQALLSAPQTGHRAVEVDPNDFYLAAVSGNGGRLLVRYWFHDKLANVRGNVRKWFEELRIADVFRKGGPSDPPRLWELLAGISNAKGKPSEKVAKVPPDRTVQLMRRALHGLPLGRTILAAALARLRVESGNARLAPGRVGLVRMCVNDIETVEKKGCPVMGETLNPSLDHPAYVCGRLLALYDGLQYAAQGEVGVTVVDRYYALASTNPIVAFPKIEELGIRHLKKLRRDKRGAAVCIQQEISELHERLAKQGAKFPGPLSLEDQGRFAIGYHHQKAEASRRIEEAKARKAEDAKVGG
jgi:CRISPR-associated protein Csd1